MLQNCNVLRLNMFAARSKRSSTSSVDLEKFKKTKAEIDPAVEYLNSIDCFCTSDAKDKIEVLGITSYSLRKGGPNEKICERVVNYMKDLDVAKLIVKILTSVARNPEKNACESHSNTCLLMQHLLITINPIRLITVVRSDLVKNGVIHPLLDDLDSCNPNTKDPMQQVRILRNIYGLGNLSSPRIDTPSIIPAYRAARAVDILMKFIEADNEFIKIESLRTLATIVNEKEGDRLATNGGCIATIVDMIVKAADTDDRKYMYKFKLDEKTEQTFGVYVYELAVGLNNLSSNDANKNAIIRHDGLPALSMLLRPDNPSIASTSEKRNAVEALWKMSFLDECKADIKTHLTKTDSTAYEGRSFH